MAEDKTIYRPEFFVDELHEAIAGAFTSEVTSAEIDAATIAVLKAMVARRFIVFLAHPGVGAE